MITVAEWCPHCSGETELVADYTVQNCSYCLQPLKPCAQCDISDCRLCPFEQAES